MFDEVLKLGDALLSLEGAEAAAAEARGTKENLVMSVAVEPAFRKDSWK